MNSEENNNSVELQNAGTLQAARPYPASYSTGVQTISCTSLQVLTTDSQKANMLYSPSFTNVTSCQLQLTGTRYLDFKAANQSLHGSNSGRSMPGVTLHHCYNPNMSEYGTYEMQEVDRYVHRQTCPHFGAFAEGKVRGIRSSIEEANRKLKGFVHASSLGDDFRLGCQNFTEQFQMLSKKTGITFPESLIWFYNKMGHTGRPACEILINSNDRNDEVFCTDLSWLCPLDFTDTNGIYHIIQEKNSFVENCLYGNTNVTTAPSYVEFAESSGGDIFYVKVSQNPDMYYYEDVLFYDHEADCISRLAGNLIDFWDILYFTEED